MTTTTTTNGSDKQGVADHYADITRPELEELYHYLSNPETDSSIAMRDISKEYGEKVANLLMDLIDR